METIQLDKLADVTGGAMARTGSVFGSARVVNGPVTLDNSFQAKLQPRVVNGPVTLDNSFQAKLQAQGYNAVQELRVAR